VYAFVRETAEDHIDAIRAVQNAVDEPSCFFWLLPHLVKLEHASVFTDDLFNLYIYYAVLSLDKKSRLLASAVGVLASLAEMQPNKQPIICELLPKLATLQDPWWETQANMAKLATALLCIGPVPKDPAAVVALLVHALASRAPSAQVVALACAVKVLVEYPKLLPAFVESLLDLPADMRADLLSPDKSHEDVHIATAGGATIDANTLVSVWPKLNVAKALMDSARAHSLDTLEPAHAEVIAALLPSDIIPHDLSEGKVAWGEWLKANKDVDKTEAGMAAQAAASSQDGRSGALSSRGACARGDALAAAVAAAAGAGAGAASPAAAVCAASRGSRPRGRHSASHSRACL
jgi:hypothetical protein